MDVQGYELNVIKGAIGTIKKYKPILLIESPEKEITDVLSHYGYLPFAFEENTLKKGYGKLNTYYISKDSKFEEKLRNFIR